MMDFRWNERCPERTVGLSHIRSQSTGRCVYCGADPSAPWPNPTNWQPPFRFNR